MKKIGILGGSFNPIHNSHVELIKKALRKKVVDEVWIVPCKKHSFNKTLESGAHRLNMINLATKGLNNVKISRIEFQSTGKSYTTDTIERLKKKFPKCIFSLIIGADITHEIVHWKRCKQLLKETSFIISKRKNYKLKKIRGMKIRGIISATKGISSTGIRKRMQNNQSIDSLVPKAVEEYIKNNRLYQLNLATSPL